jgi:hypothetical protein
VVWFWVRLLAGLGILGLLLWRVGSGPFLRGIWAIDGGALTAAVAIGVVVTVGSAWRWSLVAAGLGVRLPLREAVTAYYRSQFLNVTLPGGIAGDVHRAARHGLHIGDMGLGVRAALLDRVAGQTVQVVLTLALLSAFTSPVRAYLLPAAIVLVLAALAVAVAAWAAATRWQSVGRVLRSAGADLRAGLFARGNWVPVTAASAVVALGHLATFLVAARTAGVTAPLTVLLPLTVLVLQATAVPLSVAGWGPREGVAAWAFAATGLSASWGVASAVTFGVLVFAASLPGLGVLVHTWVRRPERQPAAAYAQGRQ